MKRLMATVAAVAVLPLAFGGVAHATTYFVRAGGDDTRPGTTRADAWATIDRVDQAPLAPGDSVLFEGGQTFTGELVPPTSGLPGLPITFGSFGSGRATLVASDSNVVWLPGRSYLGFTNLILTTGGARYQIFLSSDGTSTNVTIRGCVLTNTASWAINSASTTDAFWTIDGNAVSQTGETGITFRGHDFTVSNNAIASTGRSPTEPAHGIYAKGPNAHVVGNTITGFQYAGISIRYANSIVEGNRISGGKLGISFFEEDVLPGNTRIDYNRISNVTDAGIYLDPTPLESFVIANNTIAPIQGTPLNLQKVRALTLVNNLVLNQGPYALQAIVPFGPYSEHNDLWFPATGTAFNWNGKALSFAAYQAASGQGQLDLGQDPVLTALLAPKNGSPVIDAGSKAVPGPGLKRVCDQKPLHYCGRAPDIGSAEAGASYRPPPPAAAISRRHV